MRLDQLEIYDIAVVFTIFIKKYISQMANDESELISVSFTKQTF